MPCWDWFGDSPSNNVNVRNQTAISTNCQITVTRHRGRASARSGTSHSEYCGLHTFVVSKKASTARNASCARRGRTGAYKPSHTTAINAMINTSATAAPGGFQYGESLAPTLLDTSVLTIAHTVLRS